MPHYLPVPVSYGAPKVKLCIWKNDTLVRDLDVAFCADSPDVIYSYPLDSLDNTFTVDGRPYVPDLLDTPATVSAEADALRPAFHFTAPVGWLNDPNGCYYDGTLYHLFYQHNPVAPVWGNMHWGHAASKNLIHWEHRPIALYPDEFGTMFSGSAIIDHENVSGLGDGTTPPVLLYYTAAGGTNEQSAGQRFTQCLAYSTDGGATFTKYAGNPIIGWIDAENRDPKVYPAGDGTFVLALYLSGDRYALFTSTDLLHWTQTQTLPLPGDDECPHLFPLDTPDGKRWIFMGASGWYLTGSLANGVFTDDGCPPRRFGFDFDNDAYAAQTFYAVGDTRMRIAWNRWHHVGKHGLPYGSSMTLPHTLSLKEIDGMAYLCSTPVDLPEPTKQSAELPQTIPASIDFEIFSDKGSFTLSVCGCSLSVCGSTLLWNDKTIELPCPLRDLTVLIDRFSVEFFGADGLLHLVRSVPLAEKPDCSLSLDGGITVGYTTKEW